MNADTADVSEMAPDDHEYNTNGASMKRLPMSLIALLTLSLAGCAAEVEVGSSSEMLTTSSEMYWAGNIEASTVEGEEYAVGSECALDMYGPDADGFYAGAWGQLGTSWERVRGTPVDGVLLLLGTDTLRGECVETSPGVLNCDVSTDAGRFQAGLSEFSPELGVGMPRNPPGSSHRCSAPYDHVCGLECCLLSQGCSQMTGCYDIPSTGGGGDETGDEPTIE
jgi:hypothetical protein